jgi:hypothetical protein
VADLTPALLNSTWQLLTAEARCTLIGACHAAASAAAQPATADADLAAPSSAAPDATQAATSLLTALEIVSFGHQRSFIQAAPAAGDAEQEHAASWSEDVSAAATQRAARRAALAASAALAVRSAALEQGALSPEGQQTSSSLAAGKQKGWLKGVLSSISTGGSTFLRLLFLAAMGDVAFFPEVHASWQISHAPSLRGLPVSALDRSTRPAGHQQQDQR